MLDCDCNCSQCFRSSCSLDFGNFDFVDGVPVEIPDYLIEDYDYFLKGEKDENC